mmetsp:Transcript_158275/g.291937  ORF Transcript_158275/g.291937 Transcript_158275/m.291937 type:complete len:82 (+) Transcript_158275:3-248(+)
MMTPLTKSKYACSLAKTPSLLPSKDADLTSEPKFVLVMEAWSWVDTDSVSTRPGRMATADSVSSRALAKERVATHPVGSLR